MHLAAADAAGAGFLLPVQTLSGHQLTDTRTHAVQVNPNAMQALKGISNFSQAHVGLSADLATLDDVVNLQLLGRHRTQANGSERLGRGI
jgi:hypothetical protein